MKIVNATSVDGLYKWVTFCSQIELILLMISLVDHNVP